MKKINFQDGQLVKSGYVEIAGEQHIITEAEWKGETPLSAFNLNLMQDNIEEAIEPKEYTYTQETDSELGATITLPCYYKVGANVLDVYLETELLQKGLHYTEVGEKDTISNQIKLASDWKMITSWQLILRVRGEYINE